MKEKAPNTERNLLQVRLSENEKRNIKMMAAGQGMTLREATRVARPVLRVTTNLENGWTTSITVSVPWPPALQFTNSF